MACFGISCSIFIFFSLEFLFVDFIFLTWKKQPCFPMLSSLSVRGSLGGVGLLSSKAGNKD